MDFTKYIEDLMQRADDYGIETNYELSQREKNLLILYSFYHYYSADISKFEHLQDGLFWGKTPSPNIRLDGLYLNDTEDPNQVELDFIYSDNFKSETDFLNTKTINSIKYNLNTIKTILDNLRLRNFDDFLALKTRFNNLTDKQHVSFNVKFITNIKISETNKDSFKESVKILKSVFSKAYSFEIILGDEIIQEIEEFENPVKHVVSGKLSIQDPKSIVYFGQEMSLITTISAKSLKSLYANHSKQGLFASNLRYYVKIAKIDNAIQDTIINHPEDFWYKNNGIIIVCDDYEIKNNELYLQNFSIVNGGQTTKLIGDTDFEKDFFITAKIIKPNPLNDKEDFALEIAEATNAQKPIKPRDLIANRTEQKSLKKSLNDIGIYLKIKRGDKHNSKIYKKSWQSIDNDELTQILVCTIFQDPALAKNKTKLLTDDGIYSKIFSNKAYDSNFIKDLIYLKDYQALHLAEVNKSHNVRLDPFKITLLKNTKLISYAIFGFLLKWHFNPFLENIFLSKNLSDNKITFYISQLDINFAFINHSVVDKNLIREIFDIIYEKIIKISFSNFSNEKGGVDTSVFSKNQSVYKSFILPVLIDFINQDFRLVKKLLNDSLVNPKNYSEFIENEYIKEYTPSLAEELTEYRNAKVKQMSWTAKKVFSDSVIEKLVEEKPSSLNDLDSLNLLKPYQFNTFGPDIISMIQMYFLSITPKL